MGLKPLLSDTCSAEGQTWEEMNSYILGYLTLFALDRATMKYMLNKRKPWYGWRKKNRYEK